MLAAWPRSTVSSKTVEVLQLMSANGCRMGAFQADEVVPAIVRGAEHDTIAGLLQLGDGLLEGGSGHGRRVGVDQANAAVAAGEEVFGGGQEALAKAVAALRNQREVRRAADCRRGLRRRPACRR